MNKLGKTMMYMMGTGALIGMSYYAALPKSKKEAIKEKAKGMIKKDKDFMDELS